MRGFKVAYRLSWLGWQNGNRNNPNNLSNGWSLRNYCSNKHCHNGHVVLDASTWLCDTDPMIA